MTVIQTKAILLAPLFLAMAAAQTPPAPGPAAKSKDEKCSVEGRVLNAVSGDPIRKASLTLQKGGSAIGATKTESDDEGRFAFPDLDPGRYTLIGDKGGFAKQAYGARSNPSSGSTLVLAAGQQMKDLVFKLAPGAAILGRVLDEEGEAVSNAIMMISKTLYRRGEPQLTAVGSAQANEVGEYRIGGLKAGSYVVAAANRMMTSGLTGASSKPAGDGPEREYVTTYYPSSVDTAGATPVQLTAGAESGGANIKLVKADTVRVRGKVNGATEGKQLMLMLVPKGEGAVERLTGGRSAVAQANGTFEIAGVTAGVYTLAAVSEDANGGVRFTGQEIQVAKQHLDGVRLGFGAAGEITGAVVLEGPPPTPLKAMQVTISAPPGAPNFNTPTATVGDDGKFILKGVFATRYLAQVTGAPDTSYVKSVEWGGQDVAEEGFPFAGGAGGPLVIRLSPAGAQVTGIVKDADDNPAADVTVVLMPDSRRASLYKETRTDKNGSFTFKGVPPGDYKALAFEDIETAAYKDPEYLRKVGDKVEAASLRESDKKAVSLKVIPWQQ